MAGINWNISNERKNRVIKNLSMRLEYLIPKKGIKIIKCIVIIAA